MDELKGLDTLKREIAKEASLKYVEIHGLRIIKPLKLTAINHVLDEAGNYMIDAVVMPIASEMDGLVRDTDAYKALSTEDRKAIDACEGFGAFCYEEADLLSQNVKVEV